MNSYAKQYQTPAKARETYHHGDLKTALVEAAESIIAEEGVEGFTLRKATRKAGVSPGAPNHHFGGMAGLLTAVAARAYDDLETAFRAVPLSGKSSQDLRNLTATYVHFAMDNPGRFRLMGRMDLINPDDPALLRSAHNAMSVPGTIAAEMIGEKLPQLEDEKLSVRLAAIMAPIHGLAHMAVEQRWLRLAGTDNPERDFLDRMLPEILQSLWPDG